MKTKNEWGKRILSLVLIVLLFIQPQLVYGIGDSSGKTLTTQEQGVGISAPQPKNGNTETVKKQGDAGNQETPGETEPQGESGNQETPEETEPQGESGNQETPGETEPQGESGNQETPGKTEPQGESGNQETPGKTEPQGDAGNQETPGKTEPQGDAGNQETPGETEPQGDAGNQEIPEDAENLEEEKALQEPSDGSLAGQTMKFINLYWETDDLGDVEAVFCGGTDEELAQIMERSERGVYTTTIPGGDYSRVSFRKLGESASLAESSYNYYGAVSKDSEVKTTSFIAEKNNTFYYDMGENPSYWGADPEYQGSEAAPAAMRATEPMEPIIPDPEPGDMVYAVDLDEREKFLAGETANTYRVHIAFMKRGHKDITDLDELDPEDGEIYTMYEKETGMYSAPFPQKVGNYSEIGFKLVTKDGQNSPANAGSRHFNFKGEEPSENEEKSKFGYFQYYSGYTDTYYMNTSQDDSYWGAHPSNADQSLDSQVLYINVEDGEEGNTSHNGIIADPEQMWISWNNMPKDKAYGYDEDTNAGIAGYKIKNTLPHKWVRYFQFPKNSNATENTIFTIQFRLKQLEGSSKELTEEEKQEVHSYKFTYIPRSQRNCVNMDYIWEFNGQMWKHFEAGEGLDSRSIFFASIRNKYDEVWMRVAKEEGQYVDRTEIDNWGKDDEWIREHVKELNDNGETTIWLKLDKVSDLETDNYNKEEDKLFTLTIPDGYDKIQFRTQLDGEYYYSNEETISDEAAYPCYYAYQVGKPSETVPETTQGLMGLTGYWASVYASNTSGDQSVDIPEEEMEWEEGVYYVDTTMYDYYSDIETTGQKVAERDVEEWDANDIKYHYRLQAKVFNAALDAYYREKVDNERTDYPAIYLANFKRKGGEEDGSWNNMFNNGEEYWNHGQNNPDGQLQNAWTGANKGPNYGLAAEKLSTDGDILIKDEKAPDVEMPFFNEDFLRGNNSMDTAVGNVYKDVKFPIKVDTEEGSETEGYWVYDSSKNSDAFRLSYDVNNGYFMKRTDKGINFRGRNAFYPFNDVEDWGEGYIIDQGGGNSDPEMAKANLMFGSRFEFPFAMTEDGYVHHQDGSKHDITFEFQGDDDTWIYIDGILALDMGGIHDAVRGKINLRNGTYEIRRGLGSGYSGEGTVDKSGDLPQELKDSLKDPSKSHKVTMFYMERGLYESNLKLTFNFPRENRLTVEKEVDVESTRVEGEDDIFAGLLENMGGFNFNIKNLVTSGQEVKVEATPGYRQPGESTVLFDAVTGNKKDAKFIFENDAGEVLGTGGEIRTVIQNAEVRGDEPDVENLLKIDPEEEALNVENRDYLRLSMKNLGADDRNAQNLYISFVDTFGNRVGGYAGNHGYNGESNTFITNEDSIIRIDFKQMPGDANKFDWTKLDYMLIGIRRNNPETERASYEISYATFFEAMKEKPPIGFYIDDKQISDYGSYNSGKLSRVDGAWYLKQNKGSDSKYNEGVSWNTEAGTFNLADGQRAVFTDKFRTGSYIALNENVNDQIFTTQWTLRENGQEIPAKYLLNTRHDITTVVNPLSTITEEYPFESVEGTVIGDRREEIIEPGWNPKFQKPTDLRQTFVYRSYKDPDSSANIGTDLNVEVKNILKRGTITIKKKLTEEMQEDGTYKPAEFSFKIYYANVAGRALEKQLEPVDGDNRYLVQTVTVRTNEKGEGQTTVYNIPAGTQYWIEEVPANGTKLTKIEYDKPILHEDVGIKDENGNDYSKAYVVGTAYASDQVVTFTNTLAPFYMDIEKIWNDDYTDDNRPIQEVHIQLERRVESDPEDTWEVVTEDYFENPITEGENEYIVLNKSHINDEGHWSTRSKTALPARNQEGEQYYYRIRELEHDGIFQIYEDSYNTIRKQDHIVEGDPNSPYLHVTYQVINTPANLRLQKKWPNPGDSNMLSRIRVKLMASDQYDPNNTNEEVEWVCYKKLSNKNHNCDTNCYVSMSKDSGWSASLRNLPLQNDDNKKYYYQLADEQILIDGGWKDMTEAYGEVTYGDPVTVEKGQDGIATLTLSNEMNFGSIRLIKENKDSEKLEGAEFKIERLVEDQEKSKTEWKVDEEWNPKNATTNNQGEILFNQLQYGTYRITETKAPGGYLLNPEGIIITIPGGDLAEVYDDVEVEISDKDGSKHNIVLTIKNAELYQLPNSGGPGIYRYMISGVLLMIAAVFIIYNNKRKGEKA